MSLIKAEKNEMLSSQELTVNTNNPLEAGDFDIDYID